jgi:hypothetical protein
LRPQPNFSCLEALVVTADDAAAVLKMNEHSGAHQAVLSLLEQRVALGDEEKRFNSSKSFAQAEVGILVVCGCLPLQ